MMKKNQNVLKRVTKGIMRMALAVALLCGVALFTPATAQAASAEEVETLKAEVLTEVEFAPDNKARTMMVDCVISICFSEAGMHLEISTCTVGTASVLGVKDIKIMKKVWYGWKTVAISDGGEVYDHSMMGVDVLYANAEKDETYRVTCVHYADVDGYEEGTNDTGAFVFTY